MAHKLLNLLAVTSLAIMACSFGAEPVNALSQTHVARDGLRGHDALAKRKRSTLVRRCKPRPTDSSSADSSAVSSTPVPTAVPSTIVDSSPAPAPTSSVSDDSGSSSQAPAPAPSTSSSPVPSPAPVSNSGAKRCLPWPNGDQDLDKWKTPKVDTIYSWTETGPDNAAQLGFDYWPQLWGWTNADAFKSKVVQGYATTALFLNEPNLASQSNISPQDAVGLWRSHMAPLKGMGYRLGSAATTSAPDGKTWMQTFFDACPDCKAQTDFIVLHYYDTSFAGFQAYVEDWHNTFGLPIAVTEMADQNFNGGAQADLGQIQSFMGQAMSWMDSQDFVFKYCWFGSMRDMTNVNPLNQLMNPSTGAPNDLGNQFIWS